MLYVTLKPTLEAAFSNVDKEGVKKILKQHRDAKQGIDPPPSKPEERDRAEAYQIANAWYLGITEPAAVQAPKAKPIEGLPPATARAIKAFAEAGRFPSRIFAEDVAMNWRGILATAEL